VTAIPLCFIAADELVRSEQKMAIMATQNLAGMESGMKPAFLQLIADQPQLQILPIKTKYLGPHIPQRL